MSVKFHRAAHFQQRLYECYLSADKTAYALIVEDNKQIRFFIMSAINNDYLFCSAGEIFEKKVHQLNLHEMFDFSPNSKKIVMAFGKSIYVYNLETGKLAFSTDLFTGKIRYIKFLDDEQIVYLAESLNVLNFGNLTETQNEIDKELTQEFDLFFLNRKEKNILCISSKFNQENPGPSSTRTKLLSLDGKVSPGPVFDCIERKFNFHRMNNLLFNLFDYDPDMGSVLMDFSDYLHDGQISYGHDIHKFWDITGVPTLPIKICATLWIPEVELCGKRIRSGMFYHGPRYLFTTPDKIFTGLYNKNEGYLLEHMSRRDLNCVKLAEIICYGLSLGGTAWNKFLMRGLYDPRLLLIVWNFIGE